MAETAEQNPNTDTAGPLVGFADLSEEDFIDLSSEEKKETVIEEAEKKEPVAEVEEEVKEEVEEKVKEEVKEEEKPKLGEGEEEEEGFKNPDEVEEGSKEAEDVEANWKGIAKDVGFEIEDDSYEAFIEGKKAFIENVKTESLKDIQIKGFKEQIAELDPESQLLVLGLREGLTRDQIEAPFKEIASFKALSDVDLVAKDLELQGMPEDVIENEIEKMAENDKIEVEAKRLRIILDNNEKNLTENKLREIKELATENENIFKQTIAKESESIVKQINMIDKFLDAPVSKKNKEYLAKKWESGAYHELAKDPAKIAKFMLWEEFGEQGLSNLKSNMTSKFVEDKARKQHNIPPTIMSGSSSNSGEEAKDPVGNFGAFAHLNE